MANKPYGHNTHLRWEVQKSSEQVQPPPVRHSHNHIGHSAFCCGTEQFKEKSYHTLCSLTSVAFHGGKLSSKEVVKLL